MPVKPSPATPVPAATVVLLRDRPGGGVEVLLIRRHLQSTFAAGDWAFPGGKVEPDDHPDDAEAWCSGLTAADAARVLGVTDHRAALGFWIGAIREAFEEVGVLLAYEAGGAMARAGHPRFVEHRRACQGDRGAFWRMVRTERLRLATDRLTHFAHWITPEERPLRFDTRFFAAEMPGGQAPAGDEHEITDWRWLAPAAARAGFERGELSFRTPTMKNLGLVDGAASVAGALRALAARAVPTIRPRMVVDNGQPRTILPDEPGWY